MKLSHLARQSRGGHRGQQPGPLAPHQLTGSIHALPTGATLGADWAVHRLLGKPRQVSGFVVLHRQEGSIGRAARTALLCILLWSESAESQRDLQKVPVDREVFTRCVPVSLLRPSFTRRAFVLFEEFSRIILLCNFYLHFLMIGKNFIITASAYKSLH